MDIERYAKFDSTRKYRYLLRRKWNENLPQVTFVMLNPSKANEREDDPTLRRCIQFAKDLSYGSLEVVNLFAYIATNPLELRKVDDPVGLKNNCYIKSSTRRAHSIIVAWGANNYVKKNPNRQKEVLELIFTQKPVQCLKLTKYGYPHHPVRLSKDVTPIDFINPFL